ncbi:MAG: helix-hairpin-helix domain-containing protein [Candidatus Thiodiazotropha sp. L084R]
MGKDPYKMHSNLCKVTQPHHDPCGIGVFISAVSFMQGEAPRKWWEFSNERKHHLLTIETNDRDSDYKSP